MNKRIKKSFKNILDAWITSTVGVVVYTVTTWMLIAGKWNFQWEGVLGYVTGTVLLMFPSSLEKLLFKFIPNKNGNNDDESGSDQRP